MSRTGSRPPRGFALIEVLVTAVIVFGGITMVLRAYSLAVASMGAADDALRANALLEEQAAELEQQAWAANRVLPGSASGTFGAEAAGYRWDTRVERLSGSPEQGLAEVTLEVWRDGSVRRHSLVMRLRGSGS
jgi:Tfp pilus assembly protein PilV